MNQTLIVSTDQGTPGHWQGCLRDPSFKILWRCPHRHTSGYLEAADCARAELERRHPTPIHTGPAPDGATHIGKESGDFYRPDDEGYLVQVYRRGRWVEEPMHAHNLLASSSFIAVRGAPPREQLPEQMPDTPRAYLPELQQQMFNFETPAEVAA
ncbi:hypothetical protein [Pseudomonas indica]|uniref:Uncharacterized protein n=1 Tax=Pseudomonas indica TaxID=137658 RepID=A0A1G8V1H5_9PSED|nr:hypothetical protein [Pseudomonas indica]SDJ59819.1 hypothetical protein SAMN05216186_10264 [Pseudomonas indica]